MHTSHVFCRKHECGRHTGLPVCDLPLGLGEVATVPGWFTRARWVPAWLTARKALLRNRSFSGRTLDSIGRTWWFLFCRIPHHSTRKEDEIPLSDPLGEWKNLIALRFKGCVANCTISFDSESSLHVVQIFMAFSQKRSSHSKSIFLIKFLPLHKQELTHPPTHLFFLVWRPN